jgi:hypothetical protein
MIRGDKLGRMEKEFVVAQKLIEGAEKIHKVH